MQARLIEPGAGAEHIREIPLKEEEFLIGRGTDCDLRLPLSDISRHHCLIRIRGKEISVMDLGSANGTFVNGQRIRGQTLLHSGDQIRVGTVLFVVDLGDEIEAPWKGGADAGNTTIKVKDMHLGDKPPQGFDTP